MRNHSNSASPWRYDMRLDGTPHDPSKQRAYPAKPVYESADCTDLDAAVAIALQHRDPDLAPGLTKVEKRRAVVKPVERPCRDCYKKLSATTQLEYCDACLVKRRKPMTTLQTFNVERSITAVMREVDESLPFNDRLELTIAELEKKYGLEQ